MNGTVDAAYIRMLERRTRRMRRLWELFDGHCAHCDVQLTFIISPEYQPYPNSIVRDYLEPPPFGKPADPAKLIASCSSCRDIRASQRANADHLAVLARRAQRYQALFDAFDGRCFYCDTELTLAIRTTRQPYPNSITRDHKIPLCKGGSNAASNIVAACYRCNKLKGEKHWYTFVVIAKQLPSSRPRQQEQQPW
jgi:5-methylcytosine-specific restriction endonuclease McrA